MSGLGLEGQQQPGEGTGAQPEPGPALHHAGGFGLSSPGLGSLLWKMEAVPELGLLRCSPAAEKQIYPS